MTTLTVVNLEEILGIPEARALVWHPHLETAMTRFEINTPIRVSAFIAQIGHESGRLKYTKEVWDPRKYPWQAKYEGRIDLGNTEPGDGERFMGRGVLQATGRKMYKLVSNKLGIDFVAQPRLLERPDYAALSAGVIWQQCAGLNLGKRALAALAERQMGAGVDLNDLADLGAFELITLCINGGLNGYEDRCAIYQKARDILEG